MPLTQASAGAWERFVTGLSPLGPVPRVVLESWRRSAAAGVDPNAPRFRHVGAEELAQRLTDGEALVRAAGPAIEEISRSLAVEHVVYLVDADGIVLMSSASSAALADECRLHPGFDWSERAMGTNGAGTAIATAAPVAIIGCDHYCATWHQAACLAAPIRVGARVVGAIDLTTTVRDAGPLELARMVRVAAQIEQKLSGGPRAAASEPCIDVLVVDDDTDGRDAAVILLARRGLVVEAAAGARDALAMAAARRPRVVLLDLRMPGADGIETCWRLKAEPATAEIPVIAMSGDARSLHQARAVGCEEFLVKPVEPADMVAAVLQYCRPPRPSPVLA